MFCTRMVNLKQIIENAAERMRRAFVGLVSGPSSQTNSLRRSAIASVAICEVTRSLRAVDVRFRSASSLRECQTSIHLLFRADISSNILRANGAQSAASETSFALSLVKSLSEEVLQNVSIKPR